MPVRFVRSWPGCCPTSWRRRRRAATVAAAARRGRRSRSGLLQRLPAQPLDRRPRGCARRWRRRLSRDHVLRGAQRRHVSASRPPRWVPKGVPWIGLAPFVDESHLIQNIGDGTLSHSGTLAIRASVAAGANVTFKILYNDAVAMTGGQDVIGLMDVPSMTRALEAEGVAPDRGVRRGSQALRASRPLGRRASQVLGRDHLPEVQEELRDVPGVTVIIYDQICAAEARRLRKRGDLAEPPQPRVHQRGRVRGLRRLQHQEQLPLGPAPRDRVRDQAPDPRPVVQPRLHVPRRGLPVVRHHHAGRSGRRSASRPRRRRRRRRPRGRALPVGNPAGSRDRDLRSPVRHLLHRDRRHRRRDRQPDPGQRGRGGRARRGGHGPDRPLAEGRRGRVPPAPRPRPRRRSDRPRSAPAAPTSTCPATSCRPPAERTSRRCATARTIAVVERSFTPTAAMLQTGDATPDLAALRGAIVEQVGDGRRGVRRLQAHRGDGVRQPPARQRRAAGRGVPGGRAVRSRSTMSTTPSRARAGPATDNRAAFEWGRWAAHDADAVERHARGGRARSGTEQRRPFDPSPARARRGHARWSLDRDVPDSLRDLLVRRTAQAIDYQSVAHCRCASSTWWRRSRRTDDAPTAGR